MATKKASTKDDTVKKTTTRRSKRTTVTKAVEEPVVMETQLEITNSVPAEETTQDSSVQQNGFIAKPKYFTGSIDELNAAIQMAAQQEQQVGFNNGLQNPALSIQQQQPVVQVPVMEAQVVNPALAMGSEQKAALEQQQIQNIQTKKEEETKMVKQENLDKVNETKVEQQVAAEDAKVKALLAEKIADAVAADIKEDKSNKMRDAFVEGAVTGVAVGMGVVAGSYIVDKAITTAEEWYKNRDKTEEVASLVSGLL